MLIKRRLIHDISYWVGKEEENMDLSNKRKHVKRDRGTDNNKIYALLDEVERDEEDHIDNLLNNSDT